MTTAGKPTVLLLGGTGKVASRIAPLLSSNGYPISLASRSGTSPSSLPSCQGVKFNWDDAATYTSPFSNASISAVFLVSPTTVNPFPPMKKFIDIAVKKGVRRLVLLSASLVDIGDGPLMAEVSEYIAGLGVEYAILRPTWFMGKLTSLYC